MTVRKSFLTLSMSMLPAMLVMSCADAIKKGGPGSIEVGKHYTVTATDEWSIWELGKTAPHIPPLAFPNRWPSHSWTNEILEQSQVWTKKGFVLQQLGFINGIKTGEDIIRYAPKERNLLYKDEMSDTELTGLIAKILFLGTDDSNEISNVEVTSIGTNEARSFSVRHKNRFGYQHGLDYTTMVYAFRRQGRLDFIYFSAPSLTYFNTYWPQAEKIIRSVQFKSSP